jgi:ketosteroid isomerase-like protein
VNRFTIQQQEIRDLIDRSSDAINHQDWAALEAMMTDDVVWERMPPTPDTEAPTRIFGKARAYPQRDDVSV